MVTALSATELRSSVPAFSAVKKRFGVDEIKLQSVNGLQVDSWAEVCWVNYLEAHGIEVVRGGKYPQEYCEKYDKASGRYDPTFTATVGPLAGQQMLVEIFGGAPGGDPDYAKTQAAKEEFNKDNPRFLALSYKDCYEDANVG